MKKIFTFSLVALAFAFVNAANAQSVNDPDAGPTNSVSTQAQIQPKAEVVLVPAPKPKQKVSTSPVENLSTTKTMGEVEAFSKKIDANRNTPGFDIKKAEAELRELKESYGIK
jgi:hypothetical protein